MNEATRIMQNASVMPGYHGTASVDVVNELNDRFDTQTIICNGHLRRMVFKRITGKHYEFHTEPNDA
jgi:hypothetical protein